MSIKKSKIDWLAVVTVIIAIVTVYFQIFPPQTEIDKINNVLLLIGILIFTSFYGAIFYIYERIKFYVNKIETNEKTIKIFEDKMDMQEKFHNIDKRLALLEPNRFEKIKCKKGQLQIDLKVIIFIIILVLFYLYLRSLGLLK